MKIAGKSIDKPSIQFAVIPRESGDIVFKAGPVGDISIEFDALYPVPSVPTVHKKGKEPFKDIKNPDYMKKVKDRENARMAYMVLKSLEATEDLDWETVDLSDHSTWNNYLTELRASNLSELEIGTIINAVIKANALDSDALDEARERFLRGTPEPQENS